MTSAQRKALEDVLSEFGDIAKDQYDSADEAIQEAARWVLGHASWYEEHGEMAYPDSPHLEALNEWAGGMPLSHPELEQVDDDDVREFMEDVRARRIKIPPWRGRPSKKPEAPKKHVWGIPRERNLGDLKRRLLR